MTFCHNCQEKNITNRHIKNYGLLTKRTKNVIFKREVMYMTALQERLKYYREKNNYSQEEIAEKINLTQSAYSNYEKGKRLPSIEILIKLANIYDISLDILTGRYEVRKNIQKTEQPFRVQVARTYDGTSHRRTVTDEEMQKINELPEATDF